ncbi:PAS domain S-box protein [Algibacillus agarilyticus]|uniref:PAS domain S-box protein n=1 Tax=Algibacillus agarilyticus TaxID=2234133 RepID=UPI001E2F11E4|nr:PAS domain S-box protein [Algibacillus agarilyticus]
MNKQQENGFLNNYSQTIKTIKLLAFIALLMSLIATTFLSLSQTLAEELIWFVFYPIVVLASIYGGVVTGFFVILLSCITIHFVLLQFLPFPFSASHLNYTATLIFISLSSFIHYLLCVLKRMQSQVVSSQKSNQNERLCHSIINSMPNMVGYWDKNLYCLFANEAYQEWFNKTPQQIIGMTFRELAGEDLYQLNQENIQAVLTGKPQRFERVLTKVNGTESSIIGQYIPHFAEDGSVVGFSSIASEITDLKETQAQLKLAAYVFDNTIDGVLVTDLQGNILSVNPAFVDITGYSTHEALGQTPRILKSNRYSQDFYAYMWHQIQTTGKWNGELWSRRKNGDEFLERLSIRMVRDQDGNPLRYISVFSDITELWRINEHLKH